MQKLIVIRNVAVYCKKKTMIIEFSVQNFRSIKELQTISFSATGLKSSPDNASVDENNIATLNDYKILKTVGIYGANASGKSNIIKALEVFCSAIGELPSPESRLSGLAEPFLFQENSENSDSFFQIVFLLNGKKYRYGFTVRKNPLINHSKRALSREIIVSEWLFGPKKDNGSSVKLFTRSNLDVNKDNLPNGKKIPDLVYEHNLFLTHAASFEKNICAEIKTKISGWTTTKFTYSPDYYRFHTIYEIENAKENVLSFLSRFGLNYQNIEYRKSENDGQENDYPLENIFLQKKIDNDVYVLNMQQHESDGTKKLFDLAGLLLLVFRSDEFALILLDEIDSNFHPSLLLKLVSLFNDPAINRSNSQLLFTSHDTNLLDPALMRRDQFYFTEKDAVSATTLYSLAELKGIRNDADFAKQYLAGVYGALPIFEDLMLNSNTIPDAGTLGL